MIRITIDFGGAQVSIRERLHASIASGQTLSGRKLHTGVPLGILVALPVSLAAQLPDARCNNSSPFKTRASALGLRH